MKIKLSKSQWEGIGKQAGWIVAQEIDNNSVRLVDTISAGDIVTIITPHGQKLKGRAVMKGPHGWVLNLGGKHGTPAIASDENVSKVIHSK
jgi:hypothetical protein